MKKFIIPLFFISILFTSCVDFVETISYKNNKYHIYYKFTLSKIVLAMGNQDPEETFNNFDIAPLKDISDNMIINPIRTDLEIGAEFSIDIDPRTESETEKFLLPKKSGTKFYIPFILGDETETIGESIKDDDSIENGIGAAILSSAKCRILISKTVLPRITKAYFECLEDLEEPYDIPFYDYGESFCLEIPFMLISSNEDYKLDRVVIE